MQRQIELLEMLVNKQSIEVIKSHPVIQDDPKPVKVGKLDLAVKYLKDHPEMVSLSKRELAAQVKIDGQSISDATWSTAKGKL